MALLVMASWFGMTESYPPNVAFVVLNWVGLLLFVPVFIGVIRIIKRGTPAIIVLGGIVLLITGALAVQTLKWVLQL